MLDDFTKHITEGDSSNQDQSYTEYFEDFYEDTDQFLGEVIYND